MKEQAGGTLTPKDSRPIDEYIMGDLSSTIYPVNGGLEDWAYGGGWDTYGDSSTVDRCEPYTYVLQKNFY